MRLVMGHFRLDGHHDVQTLAARNLRPTGEAFSFEKATEFKGGITYELPRDAFAGIEIKDEPVGMLDILNHSVPRMQFDYSNLDEAKQALEILDPQSGACAPLSSF